MQEGDEPATVVDFFAPAGGVAGFALVANRLRAPTQSLEPGRRTGSRTP